jgi:hypothetical protein
MGRELLTNSHPKPCKGRRTCLLTDHELCFSLVTSAVMPTKIVRNCQSCDHDASWTPAQPTAFAVRTHVQSHDDYRLSTSNEIFIRLSPWHGFSF